MCPLPAVGYSPFCSEDCSEAYFAQEPPGDGDDYDGLDEDHTEDREGDFDWVSALKEDVDKGY